MKNILYVIAVILLICWAVGFFIYSVGYVIHLLLLLALITLVLRLIGNDRTR